VDNAGRMISTVAQASKISPSQAAEILGLQKRTLRRWSSLFTNALSPSAGAKGRKRFYNGSDIATLQRAQKLKDQGMQLSEIASVLPVVPADEDESTSVVLAPEANLALGQVIERARAIGDELVDQDERLVDQNERLRRIEEFMRLPWYRRLFKKPTD